MSVTIVCDYCGEPIEGDLCATVNVSGEFPDDKRSTGQSFCNWTKGHYHTDQERQCYWRISESIELTEEVGPTLETIPTISNQRVAARRRKHSKPTEGER